MSISYAFIFSPNNSGTTIMSQYLTARLKNSYLPPFGNYEGQMAPSVKSIMRTNPWNSDSEFDWDYIKSEWDDLAAKSGKNFFIEASPPNIMRVSNILKVFPSCIYVFSISSPYSYIASHSFNYNPEKLSLREMIQKATCAWIKKANVQKLNMNTFTSNSNILTYEDFCVNPELLLKKLQISNQDINDDGLQLKGKNNTHFSKIVDMLPKHLSFLGASGILQVNEILSQETELLGFFGYKLLDLRECNAILSQNMLLAFDGLDRRNQFK